MLERVFIKKKKIGCKPECVITPLQIQLFYPTLTTNTHIPNWAVDETGNVIYRAWCKMKMPDSMLKNH